MVPLHVDPEAYTLRLLTVEVHKQNHQASHRARTLEYCPRSCRRTTRVKSLVERILRMTCNSRNSRKFRPAKFKRYTVFFQLCRCFSKQSKPLVPICNYGFEESTMSFPSTGCMGGSVAAATSPSPPAAEWLLCPPTATSWIPTPAVPPYIPICPCIPTSSGTCPGLCSPATATHDPAAERGLLYVASRAAWTYRPQLIV